MWDPPSLDISNEEDYDQQLSDDSDEEVDTLTTSLVLPSLQTSFARHHPSLPVDDETDMMDGNMTEKERNLAHSYAQLAELGPPVELQRRDKWHDWIQMQNEWMDRVETDPDNYFDDYL